MRLTIRPRTLRKANAYVKEHHRHSDPTRGHKFSVSLVDECGFMVGVAIAGRPKSRKLDNGLTLEILRVATDGSFNACSMLYAACRKAGFAMGYIKVITYTLETEGGASLRAAGFIDEGEAGARIGQSWNVETRPRQSEAAEVTKRRWACVRAV